MPPGITLRLKPASLNAAIRKASIATGKLPAELANRAVFSIAIRARKAMPKTSPSRIAAELEESKVHELVALKSGRWSKSKKHVKSVFGGGSDAPLLALIIQSRVGKGGAYGLQQSPWKGVTRAEGAMLMLAKMRQVFGARKRSVGFFVNCARVVSGIFGNGSSPKGRGRLADGVKASGTGKASAKWWISATMPDTEGSHDALRKIAEPVWQAALDAEAASITKHAMEHSYREALRLAGFRVT